MGYTVRRLQETGQNKTKSWASRPKLTRRAEDKFIWVTSWRDRRLTAPYITAQLNQYRKKNVSTSTVRRRLWSWPILQNCYQKTLFNKQKDVKRLHWVKSYKDWTTKQWNKVLWTDESKFKIFESNRTVYVWRRVGERAANSWIAPTVKHTAASYNPIWNAACGSRICIYT